MKKEKPRPYLHLFSKETVKKQTKQFNKERNEWLKSNKSYQKEIRRDKIEIVIFFITVALITSLING